MNDRIQFNVRLDKHPALYEALKSKAQEEGVTLNELAIHAFQQALGWEVEHNPAPVRRTEIEEMLAKMLAPINQRMEELERQVGECKA
jgi:hypothetical protein